jgi:tRNA/rRNA methyltransferase
VLQNARIVGSVEEALQLCCRRQARLREFSPPVVSPRELAGQLSVTPA